MSLQSYLSTSLKVIEFGLLGTLIALFFVIISPLLPTKKLLASYAVISGSMEPTVPVGALAVVQETSGDQLQRGDVIAFPEPGNPQRIVLHRITDSLKSGSIIEFKTKGDNNQVEDQWLVPAAGVKGKLVASVPYVGYPIKYAQTPIGYLIVVGIPAFILVGLNLKSIYEGIEEEIQKRAALRNKYSAEASAS